LAIASLVLGLLALLSSLFVVGALFGLVGLLLGVVHLARRTGRNGLAWTGIGLSILGLVASVVLAAVYLPFLKEGFRAARQIMEQNSGGADFAKWEGVLAPDLSVTTLDGQAVKLSDFKGRRVVVDFWATWCPPCVKEIPHFIRLRHEVPADQLVLLGISDEDADTLKSFVKKHGVNYPIASADGLPAPYGDVTSIPTTFFIDRHGVIQKVMVGYHDFDELKTRALAEDWTGEPRSAPPAPASGLTETGRRLQAVEVWSRTLVGAQALGSGDWDEDGVVDILVMAADRKLHVLGNDGSEKTAITLPDAFSAIECGRHRSDGVRLLGYDNWGSRVSVMDRTGKELWTYATKSGVDGAHWGDLDGDGTDELVVGMNGFGGLHAVGADGRQRWAVSGIGNVWNQAVVPAGPDRPALVFATEAGGTVRVFDAKGKPLRTLRPLNQYCAQMTAAVMDGTNQVQAVAVGGSRVIAFDPEGNVAWSTPAPKGAGSWRRSTFACGDLNGDGIKEWAFLEAGGDLVLASATGEKIAAWPNATGLTAFLIVPPANGKGILVTLTGDDLRAFRFD
jgi:cytochrome c biogenesis protein CcmG/thiol:disulfide interchange protein DsbE